MSQKIRVLVLGADGFLGRQIVQGLRNSDWALPIRAGRRTGILDADGLERKCFDACDQSALSRALDDTAGVVNCVAGGPETLSESARALFAATADRPEIAVVHMSSMAVYGSVSGRVTETAPMLGDMGAYGLAKIQAERFAAVCPQAVILRPGIIYGADSPQWSRRIARWLQSRRIGDLGKAGDGFANLVHVEDVTQATLNALRFAPARGQIFNLSLPNPPTWNEYFLAFAKALDAVPIRRISARALKVETKLIAPPLKILEIFARKLSPGLLPRLPEAIPPSLLGLWRQRIQLDVSKAESLLEMKWTPLSAALAKSVSGQENKR